MIDSDDLPLNVSREILQESKILKTIKRKIIRKIIAAFQDVLDDDREKFLSLYKVYNLATNINS